MAEENQEPEEDFDLGLNKYLTKEKEVILQTHNKVDTDLSGKIIKLEKGHVELTLETTKDMLADDMGLIHGGFIFVLQITQQWQL